MKRGRALYMIEHILRYGSLAQLAIERTAQGKRVPTTEVERDTPT